jgi:predicted restriction endonuclease
MHRCGVPMQVLNRVSWSIEETVYGVVSLIQNLANGATLCKRTHTFRGNRSISIGDQYCIRNSDSLLVNQT